MRPKGFRGYMILTVGQLVSIAGSAMTQFGLGIWMWKTTGNATPFSMITFAFFLPNMLFSTFAGSLVDRLPRKITLILPDLAAGLITLLTLIFYLGNRLSLPFLYITSFFSGIFNAFQWPAYSVTMSSMLKKEEYGKANGLFSLTETAPSLIAPILAGALMGVIGLEGIMVIDIVTCIFAISMVILVDVGQNLISNANGLFDNILKDSVFGFRYIFERKSLLSLLMIFLLTNIANGFWNTLFSPMILGKFNNDSLILGTVETVFGAGGVLGGLIMSFWGGTKKKIYTLLSGILLGGVGAMIMGASRSLVLVLIAVVINGVSGIFANSASQSIWQSAVPIELQGRVFSARRFIAQFASIIPMVLSGPLVDKVLYNYFKNDNLLTQIFGAGKGSSIGFLAFLAGIIVILVAIFGFLNPLVVNVEQINFEDKKEVAL